MSSEAPRVLREEIQVKLISKQEIPLLNDKGKPQFFRELIAAFLMCDAEAADVTEELRSYYSVSDEEWNAYTYRIARVALSHALNRYKFSKVARAITRKPNVYLVRR